MRNGWSARLRFQSYSQESCAFRRYVGGRIPTCFSRLFTTLVCLKACFVSVIRHHQVVSCCTLLRRLPPSGGAIDRSRYRISSANTLPAARPLLCCAAEKTSDNRQHIICLFFYSPPARAYPMPRRRAPIGVPQCRTADLLRHLEEHAETHERRRRRRHLCWGREGVIGVSSLCMFRNHLNGSVRNAVATIFFFAFVDKA